MPFIFVYRLPSVKIRAAAHDRTAPFSKCNIFGDLPIWISHILYKISSRTCLAFVIYFVPRG